MKQACEECGDLYRFDDPFYQNLYASLLDTSFTVNENKKEYQKEMAISYLGSTPIMYSLKYEKDKEQRSLRCVAEPGGRCITVAQQIDFCLQQLSKIFGENGWMAASDINRMTQIIYPAEEKDTRGWLSGMWLGMDGGITPPAIKIYLNLRHQSKELRWSRLKELFTSFGDHRFAATYSYMKETLYETGIPVGLGCAVGKNGILGFRIYFAFPNICKSLMEQVYEKFYPGRYKVVNQVASDIIETFGEVASNLTLEFVLGDDGVLDPEPYRIKTELSLCAIPEEKRERLVPWISEQMKRLEMNDGMFREELSFMELYFDSVFFQYLSVGVGKEGEHLTIYLEPVMKEKR